MNTIKKKFEAVIFDMNDTIVKTANIGLKLTQGILKSYDIEFTHDQLTDFSQGTAGLGSKEICIALKKYFSIPGSIDTILSKRLALASDIYQSCIEYIDGFEDFQHKLTTYNIPNAIATNAHPTPLEVIKKTMKLSDKFGEHIYSIALVDFKAKPDPSIFLYTAQQLGAKPEKCVVFEDSLEGFKAARSAGMKCIAIQNNENKHLLDYATTSISSYYEAEDVLNKI